MQFLRRHRGAHALGLRAVQKVLQFKAPSVTTPSVQRSSVQFARSQQVPRPPGSPPRSCKPAQSPRKAVEIAAVCSIPPTTMDRRRCRRHRRQHCFFLSQLQPRRDLCTRTQWCACCDSRARDSRSQRRHRGCPVPCFSAAPEGRIYHGGPHRHGSTLICVVALTATSPRSAARSFNWLFNLVGKAVRVRFHVPVGRCCGLDARRWK